MDNFNPEHIFQALTKATAGPAFIKIEILKFTPAKIRRYKLTDIEGGPMAGILPAVDEFPEESPEPIEYPAKEPNRRLIPVSWILSVNDVKGNAELITRKGIFLLHEVFDIFINRSGLNIIGENSTE